MHLPEFADFEMNLRHCLLLKADDLYFTLAEPLGEALRDNFLGFSVQGLADENVSDDEIASINLGRFAITQKVSQLYAMLAERKLSLDKTHSPDAEDGRTHSLEFLEHFLSTLPNVSLGGLDRTAARNGETRQIYNFAYAWLNLIETIDSAFDGKIESALAVSDLALLSGLDTRTLRNRCGPGKIIRTSSSRSSQSRDIASPAFVTLHTLDSVDWLRSRKDFEISRVDTGWLKSRLADATPLAITRGIMIASVINLGSLSELGKIFEFTVEDAREWFDQGDILQLDLSRRLSEKLELNT